MPSFQQQFTQSKGKPIRYEDQELHLVDYVPVEPGDCVKVIIESTKSEWRQGVRIKVPGTLEVRGRSFDVPLVLWEDTAPKETEVLVLDAEGPLQVNNVWDTGRGVTQSWHNGAAMIIERLPSGRRYRCNDGHPDDDFDDIVFSVEFG